MFGLVPGLEFGLLELEPESLLLCLGPTPAVTPALGKVALPRPGEPRRGVLVPASRVLLRQLGVAGLESNTVELPISLLELPAVLTPEPAPGVTVVWLELAAGMLGLLSLNDGGRGGGQSEPELGRSSLEPEENQDSRHDSQFEYWIVLELGEGRG